MELPRTTQGNRYVVVFQDFLSKFPLVFPAPDQKSLRIAKLLVEEVVPLFGVPEALLSNRRTNLLSHLMKEVCVLLRVKKLNTTAYHPQCNGMVEQFNRTLKSMYESTQPSSVHSGTGTFTEYCGRTETPRTRVRERNHPSYCLATTVAHPQKLRSFPRNFKIQWMLTTTEKR